MFSWSEDIAYNAIFLNPIVVGLFDSPILVGGQKIPPLPNS